MPLTRIKNSTPQCLSFSWNHVPTHSRALARLPTYDVIYKLSIVLDVWNLSYHRVLMPKIAETSPLTMNDYHENRRESQRNQNTVRLATDVFGCAAWRSYVKKSRANGLNLNFRCQCLIIGRFLTSSREALAFCTSKLKLPSGFKNNHHWKMSLMRSQTREQRTNQWLNKLSGFCKHFFLFSDLHFTTISWDEIWDSVKAWQYSRNVRLAWTIDWTVWDRHYRSRC